MKPIRVLIADDHPLFRRGLVNLLEEEPDIHVVGEAATGPQAVELAAQVQPDVVLMDVILPGGGVAATQAICKALPQVKVVMLTVSETDADLFGAIEAGASGYLLKEVGPEELVEAVHQAYAGQATLSPAVAVKVSQRVRQEPAASSPVESSLLTPREVEVIQLLAQGLTNQEIAQRLIVAESTVKTHIRNVLRKTHTHNRTEIVAWAMQMGLIGNKQLPENKSSG
jgi:DNA-binding NarL/FixJ family response regulator